MNLLNNKYFNINVNAINNTVNNVVGKVKDVVDAGVTKSNNITKVDIVSKAKDIANKANSVVKDKATVVKSNIEKGNVTIHDYKAMGKNIIDGFKDVVQRELKDYREYKKLTKEVFTIEEERYN